MKKILSILMALAVVFTLCGAGAIAESMPTVDPEGANQTVVLDKYNPSHTGDIEHTPSGETDPAALIFNGAGGAGELVQDGNVTETLDASKTVDELNTAVMLVNGADAKISGSADVVYQNSGGEGVVSVVNNNGGKLVLEGTGADDGELRLSDTVGQPGADSAPAISLILLGGGEAEKAVSAKSGEMNISGNILDYSETLPVVAVMDMSNGGDREIVFDDEVTIAIDPESGSEIDSTLVSTLYAGFVDDNSEDNIKLSFGGPVSMQVHNTASGSGEPLFGPSGIATLLAVGSGKTDGYDMNANFMDDVALEAEGVLAKASVAEFELRTDAEDFDAAVELNFGGDLRSEALGQFYAEAGFLDITGPGEYTVNLPENGVAEISANGVISQSQGIVIDGQNVDIPLDVTVNGDVSLSSEGSFTASVIAAEAFDGGSLTVNGGIMASAVADEDGSDVDIEGLFANNAGRIHLTGDLRVSAEGDSQGISLIEAYGDGTEIKVGGDVDFDFDGDIITDFENDAVNTVSLSNGAKVEVGGNVDTDLVQAVKARTNDVELKVGGDVVGGTKTYGTLPDNYSMATVEVNVAKEDSSSGEIVIQGTVKAENGGPALALTFEVENGGRPTEDQIKNNIPGLYVHGLTGGGLVAANLRNEDGEYEAMTEEDRDALIEACAEAINYIVKLNGEGDNIDLSGENIRHRDDIGYYANEEKTFRAVLGDTFDNEYELTGGDGNVTITPVEGKPGEYTVTVHRGGGVTLTAKVTAKPKIDEVELNTNTFTFDGNEHAPAVSAVRSSGTVLSADDYTVETLEKGTNAGEYRVRVKAKPESRFGGGAEAVWNIVPANISKVVLTRSGYENDGKPHKPAIKAVYAGNIALNPDEYTVTGLDKQTEAGSYTVTVMAKPGGNFTGGAKAVWSITGAAHEEERAKAEKAAAEVGKLLKSSKALKEAFKGVKVAVEVTADNKVVVTAEPKEEFDEETGEPVKRLSVTAETLAELAAGGADMFAARDASSGAEAAMDFALLAEMDISGGVTVTLKSAEDMDADTKAAVDSAFEEMGYKPLSGGVFLSVTGTDAKGEESDLSAGGAVRVRIAPAGKDEAGRAAALLFIDAENAVTEQEFELTESSGRPCLETVCCGSGWYMAGE